VPEAVFFATSINIASGLVPGIEVERPALIGRLLCPVVLEMAASLRNSGCPQGYLFSIEGLPRAGTITIAVASTAGTAVT